MLRAKRSTAGLVSWGVSWGQSYEKGQTHNSEARPFIWTTRLNASFLHDPNMCSAWPYLTLVPEDEGVKLGKHTQTRQSSSRAGRGREHVYRSRILSFGRVGCYIENDIVNS